jgi:hypothetical protein
MTQPARDSNTTNPHNPERPETSRTVSAVALFGVTVVGGLLSFMIAVLSVNALAIGVFLVTNVVCVLLSMDAFKARSTGRAFVFAVLPIPLAFGLLYAYTVIANSF